MLNLICKYNDEILAYGTVRTVEEFIFVEIPHKNPVVLSTLAELKNWLDNAPGWEVLQ